MDNDKFKRIIATIGLKNFVYYYEDYKGMYLSGDELTNEDKKIFAKRILEENEEADSFQAQITRINKALKIFEEGFNIEALDKAIKSKHNKITAEVKQKAKILKQKEILNAKPAK